MVIIIGQGAAGTSAANQLRQLDPTAPVTVITNEADYFYSRIDLPDIISGKITAASSELQSADAFGAKGITCRMGETVGKIRPQEHTVELASGERLTYHKLLLATGSMPVLPPLDGVGKDGVHTVWTLAQARQVIAAASESQSAVVVGAGLIGLKTALALSARGLLVTVVERAPRLLPRQLDEAASTLVAKAVAAKGVVLRLGTQVDEVVAPHGRVTGVRMGRQIVPCEMVIMAVGVQPNVALAHEAGLTVNRGIATNESMQTSDPDIYAAGDVAEVTDKLTGQAVVPAIWPSAVEQGAVAAINMAGGHAAYAGSLAMNSVEIAGVSLVSVGEVAGEPGDQIVVSERGDDYKKVILRHGIVRGVLFVGDIRQAGVFASLIERGELLEMDQTLLRKFTYANLLAT